LAANAYGMAKIPLGVIVGWLVKFWLLDESKERFPMAQ
jgi:hypothetical protein